LNIGLHNNFAVALFFFAKISPDIIQAHFYFCLTQNYRNACLNFGRKKAGVTPLECCAITLCTPGKLFNPRLFHDMDQYFWFWAFEANQEMYQQQTAN
jgi:hypothetical protein